MSIKLSVRWPLVAGIAIAAAVAGFSPAWAGIGGVEQRGEGKYADLSATWWAWIFSQPTVDVDGTNTNPILDSTGAYAAAGQEHGIGPANRYFFLAGAFGGTVERTVTVPAGKELFFPVLNLETDNATDPPTNNKVPMLRALARANIDGVTTAEAWLNGEPIEVFRTKSPVFSYTLPEENSIYAYFGLSGPQFEGTVKPVVSDGYWAHIPPLEAGDYIIEFVSATSAGFTLEVRYNLTVE